MFVYYHMDNFDIVNSILIEGVITLFDIEYFMKMGEVDIKKILISYLPFFHIRYG